MFNIWTGERERERERERESNKVYSVCLRLAIIPYVQGLMPHCSGTHVLCPEYGP